MRNDKITPLYVRLSRDHELQGDSNSIIHLKQMLEEYARKRNAKTGYPRTIYVAKPTANKRNTRTG